jgi:hypothetical protein
MWREILLFLAADVTLGVYRAGDEGKRKGLD